MKNVMLMIELTGNSTQMILLELPTLTLLGYTRDLSGTMPKANVNLFGDLVQAHCVVETGSEIHRLLTPSRDCLVVNTKGNREISRCQM